MSPTQWIDLTILAITALVLLRGVSSGVAHGLLDVAALIAAFTAARFGLDKIVLPAVGSLPPVAQFPIFLVLWIVLYVFLALATKLAFKIVKIQFISPVEQVGGLIVAAAKMILLLGMLQNGIRTVPGGAEYIQKSIAFGLLRPLQNWIQFVPGSFPTLVTPPTGAVKDSVDSLKKILEKELKKNLPDIPTKL